MCCLLTGGLGFIGQHTLFECLESEIPVVVLDNSQAPAADIPAPVVRGDVRDTGTVRQVIRDYSVSGVIHLAASTDARESVSDPASYCSNNVVGTLSLLEAMRAEDVKSLVFASSCAVYGSKADPACESDSMDPDSPYGESKVFGERAVRAFSAAYGIGHVTLRYFNVAGADARVGYPQSTQAKRRLVARLLAAAVGFGPAVQIRGVQHTTKDGSPVRDYVHVQDVARANVIALRYLRSGGENRTINIGTGVGTSLFEVLSRIRELYGVEPPVSTGSKAPGDPASIVADGRLAEEILRWQPLGTLDGIISSTHSALLHERNVRQARVSFGTDSTTSDNTERLADHNRTPVLG